MTADCARRAFFTCVLSLALGLLSVPEGARAQDAPGRAETLRLEIDALTHARRLLNDEISSLSAACPLCEGDTEGARQARQRLALLRADHIYMRYAVELREAELEGGPDARQRAYERLCPACEASIADSPEALARIRRYLEFEKSQQLGSQLAQVLVSLQQFKQNLKQTLKASHQASPADTVERVEQLPGGGEGSCGSGASPILSTVGS